MTIYKTVNYAEHFGNGISVDFPYEFFIPDEDSLQVYLITDFGVTLVDPAFYSASGIGESEEGGYVTYPITEPVVPLTSSTKLRIVRSTELTQEIVFSDQTRYNASAHQVATDKLTVMVQDIWDATRRAPKVGVAGTRDLVFPEPVANSWLGFDGLGQIITTTSSPSSIISSIELNTWAELAAFTRAAGVTTVALRGGLVAGDGMGGLYVFDPLDGASPSAPPFTLVSLDGSRFKLASSERNFGLGELSQVPLVADVDLTNIPSGQYRTSAASTGTLPVAATSGVLLYQRAATGEIVQTFGPMNSDLLYRRRYVGAAWTGWVVLNPAVTVRPETRLGAWRFHDPTVPGNTMCVLPFRDSATVVREGVRGFKMDRGGRIVGAGIAMIGERNGGALTLKPYLNGVMSTFDADSVQLNATNLSSFYRRVPWESGLAFAAGVEVNAGVNTNISWGVTPASNNDGFCWFDVELDPS